jgi:hypothetical protein
MARTTAAYAHAIADGQQDSDARGDTHFHSNANGDRDTHSDADPYASDGHGRRFPVAHLFLHAHSHTIAYVHADSDHTAHSNEDVHAEPDAVTYRDAHSLADGHTVHHSVGCPLAYGNEPRDSLGDGYREPYAVCHPGHDPHGQSLAVTHSPWDTVAGELQL